MVTPNILALLTSSSSLQFTVMVSNISLKRLKLKLILRNNIPNIYIYMFGELIIS
jgi:hypothetical protein